MVAHRTLTPFVRVRILHPLPKQLTIAGGLLFYLPLGTRTRTKQIKSAHEVPKALREFESFIRCQKQFIGFDELFFIMDRIFRTGNTRRQLPRRAFQTIRDYPRICAMPTSMTADETYPTCCLPHKRPEPAQEPTERALGQYLIPVPQCPSPGLR